MNACLLFKGLLHKFAWPKNSTYAEICVLYLRHVSSSYANATVPMRCQCEVSFFVLCKLVTHTLDIDFFPLWTCSIANNERRSSVIVFCSGVFNLFIDLKLHSAAHADTGYIKSVFTATKIPLMSYFWVECSTCFKNSL